MKSFFALATAFALTIVPVIKANPVPAGAPMHFFSYFQTDFVIGTEKLFDIFRPFPNGALIWALPGNGTDTDYTTWVLTAGTNEVGQIQLYGQGILNSTLCVTSRNVDNDPDRIARLDICDVDDPTQLWTVSEGTPAVISQNNQCITIQGDSPEPDDKLVIVQCDVSEPGRLWNPVQV